MECLDSNATAEQCDIVEMIGYLAGLLAVVFICSCIVSGCCFYCRWKIRRPNVGAITLKSSEGKREEVKFRIWKKGSQASLSAAEVSAKKSTASAGTIESGKSTKEKTVVSWNVDPRASGRSLTSTGRVMLTTVGEDKTPKRSASAVSEASVSAKASPKRKLRGPRDQKPVEMKPSHWRSRIAGLASRLSPGTFGLRKDAYELQESVEYFSKSNGIWTAAVITSSGQFDKEGNPSYHIRVGRQRRYRIPLEQLRPVLQPGEPAGFFSVPDSKWISVKISGVVGDSHMLGYRLEALGETKGEKNPSSVAGRLRRHFNSSDRVRVYLGPLLGWAEALVVEDAVEAAEEVPGQRMADDAKEGGAPSKARDKEPKADQAQSEKQPAVTAKPEPKAEEPEQTPLQSPEVTVKVRMLQEDPEDGEVLEMLSGYVRFAANE
ncbi:unnamed protein product [Effrenium voratum]|nr:unnamed protein product [Effrenium voratum]